MSEPNISVTTFRAQIYAMIDRVIESGEPLIIERGGQKVEIRRMAQKPKKAALKAAPKPVAKSAKPPRKKAINDLSKLIKGRNCMTEPPEWYISPKLYVWEPDEHLS